MLRSIALLCLLAATLQAEPLISWQRVQLSTEFYAEGATAADIDKDGHMDIISGPFWYAGPDWQTKHAFYEPKVFSINGYSDNFFAYAHDFTGDGWLDVLVLGFPGKEARLYVSPGAEVAKATKPWAMHLVADVVDNESPTFTDITGDGKPEIVCSTGGRFGYFAPDWANPTAKWPFVAVTEDMKVAKFTHGLGVGDVNGDGKLDLLEARRWWEAPSGAAVGDGRSKIGDMPGNPTPSANSQRPSPAAQPPFIQHNFAAGVGGGAQMFAYDFDGNGANDVFTSLAAHRYGVAVFLQAKRPAAPSVTGNGKRATENEPGPTWQRVMLSSEHPADNDYGIVFSQPHAAALADINGDGIQDIVTGKRYWAHNGHDPDEHGARVVYWYQTTRDGKGGVDFLPHLIDAESGVGVDVQTIDVNADKLLDIVVGNKAGVYVLLQQRHEAKADQAQALQPRKLYGPALKPQKDYAQGQSPAEALKAMQLPGGFTAELIASEPDLVQPIAFTFDERGRIWVVEGRSYPQPREPGAGQDKIKILEDQDGDGRYETVKTFCEGISLASGIELGFGGVWVGAAPYLMFIPRDGDQVRPLAGDGRSKIGDGATAAGASPPSAISHLPSSAAQQLVPGLPFQAYALLDGFGSQDTHETLNSFIWGPDGWLYGCHGVFTHSLVGKPGTADKDRTPINAGVWRYHPVRHVFEVFAHGTSNPWGLDYDQNGEFFVTACVIPHLYHIVPGGRYHRQGGQHFNPYTYEDIQTIADHAHYAGNIRDNAHWGPREAGAIVQDDTNAAGGGHAHCGLAIYQSDQFPADYRNRLIFGNLHGHRLVSDYLTPHGSTYIGKHGSDFMRANDMHFIPVTQKVGPDGSLYVSDWSDKQVCHRGSGAVELWDRSNGRLYRVSYSGADATTAKNTPGTAATPTSLGEHGLPGRTSEHPASDRAAPGKATPSTSTSAAATRETPAKSNTVTQAQGAAPSTAPKGDSQDARRNGLEGRAPQYPRAPFDLAKESNERLAELAVQTENEWFSRTARRILAERAQQPNFLTGTDASGNSLRSAFSGQWESLRHQCLEQPGHEAEKLRVNWLDHILNPGRSPFDPPTEPNPQTLAAQWRLLTNASRQAKPPFIASGAVDAALKAIANPTAQLLRRELASSLQVTRLWRSEDHLRAATALITHGEDKDDPYIPLLLWYGIEPLVGADPQAALELAKASKLPKVTEFIYRRMGAEEAGRAGLLKLAADTADSAQREALLTTVLNAARAGNKVSLPADWARLKPRLGSSPAITELEAFMGLEPAIQSYRTTLASAAAPGPKRQAAMALLTRLRDPFAAKALQELIITTAQPSPLRQQAIQSLAAFNDPETPAALTGKFSALSPAEQQDAINTLATSAPGAIALLSAVKAKTIPASHLSPFLARQIDALADPAARSLLKEVFGDLNAPQPDLAARKAKLRPQLTPAQLAKADLAKGKVLFAAICGQCHRLLGEGQAVGPDLTGSNRADLDYLLDNILDPNAVIGKAYQLNLFELKDGRVASGVIKEETPSTYRIAMPGGLEQTLTVAEVKKRTISKASTMPTGLLDALPSEMLQPLIAYLQSNPQPSAAAKPGATAMRIPGALEGEALTILAKTGKGRTQTQSMGGFRSSTWSGSQQLWWVAGQPGDTLTLALPVPAKGRYQLSAALTKAIDYGVATVKLNGQLITPEPLDFYNQGVIHTGPLDWGSHDLEAGQAKLEITLQPANPAAKPMNMIGLDYVKLEPR